MSGYKITNDELDAALESILKYIEETSKDDIARHLGWTNSN